MGNGSDPDIPLQTKFRKGEVEFHWSGPRFTAVLTVAATLLTYYGTHALDKAKMDIEERTAIHTLQEEMVIVKQKQDANTEGRIKLQALIESNAVRLEEIKRQQEYTQSMLLDHERRTRALINALPQAPKDRKGLH